MSELRDYQRALLKQVWPALGPQRARVMMQLPTGGGKTIIAAQLLADWLQAGHRAVWLTHRKELADQTCEMLTAARLPAMNDVRWNPGMDAPAMRHGVVILMAQTVSRRTAGMNVWNRYSEDDLLVLDEAHHATARGWTRAMQQWPGRVMGMTATPWRLSKKEGFDHLFDALVCGPQTSALQSGQWLCEARVLIPPPEQRILGGEVDLSGEYTEGGIERANRARRNVMTAQALLFWQKHAGRRQTIIYAVSVEHANNLAAVFSKAGVPAAVMPGDTPPAERARLIAEFKNETLNVLVNVAVATEGFDLPDASCVVLARPTKSLALYLQMVGRGLRPKAAGGNCLILDLAANALAHGLPEENRIWSLAPRGEPAEGQAPVVWCQHCDALSSAASHHCRECGAPFGKDCARCGKWRSWKSWSLETHCGSAHELVCDLCHRDAHIQAQLPVPEQVQALSGGKAMEPDDKSKRTDENDPLEPELAPILQKLLEEERRRALGPAEERWRALQLKIEAREAKLNDDSALDALFSDYLDTLPGDQLPGSALDRSRLHLEWHENVEKELADWKEQLAGLKTQTIDKRLIFNHARERLITMFRREAAAAELLPQDPAAHRPALHSVESPAAGLQSHEERDPDGSLPAGEEIPLSDLASHALQGRKPSRLIPSTGEAISIRSWAKLLAEVAEWLAQQGHITSDHCPIHLGRLKTALIDTGSISSPTGKILRQETLPSGFFVYVNFPSNVCVQTAVQLLERFDEDPSQFSVHLAQSAPTRDEERKIRDELLKRFED